MSEPIQFCASVEQVNGGDDEIRLVLAVKDSTADLAAAVSMLGRINRILHVAAYLGADALAEFRAAIPPIKTGVQFRAKRPPVIRLDIPASDALHALRLIGYSERVIRFEVEDAGERTGKAKQSPQGPKAAKEPTPYGALWQELLHRNMGFEHIPGVKETLEEVRASAHEDPHQLMRKVFNVGSLSRMIGPREIEAKFPYPGVKPMIEQAMERIGGKQ